MAEFYPIGPKQFGTVTKLSGNIHIASFFISDSSVLWSDSAMETMKERLYEAESWLMAEAKKYGKELYFLNDFFGGGWDVPIIIDSVPELMDDDVWEITDKVLEKRNFISFKQYVEWAGTRGGCDQFMVLLFSVKSDRSYSLPAWKAGIVDSCVLHSDDQYQSIIHEMLHLFGAWDMYTIPWEKSSVRGDKCAAYFANSIMRTISGCNLEIDEVNAWLVGLKNEKKRWYELFYPDRDRSAELKNLTLYYDKSRREYSDIPYFRTDLRP